MPHQEIGLRLSLLVGHSFFVVGCYMCQSISCRPAIHSFSSTSKCTRLILVYVYWKQLPFHTYFLQQYSRCGHQFTYAFLIIMIFGLHQTWLQLTQHTQQQLMHHLIPVSASECHSNVYFVLPMAQGVYTPTASINAILWIKSIFCHLFLISAPCAPVTDFSSVLRTILSCLRLHLHLLVCMWYLINYYALIYYSLTSYDINRLNSNRCFQCCGWYSHLHCSSSCHGTVCYLDEDEDKQSKGEAWVMIKCVLCII